MGLKFLVPLSGLALTTTGAVGLSSSNQRSHSAASISPNHKWKIEVDEIKVEMECNGSSGSATFKWSVKLDEEYEKKLFQEETVNKEVDVKLVGQEGKTLWPDRNGGIRALKSQAGASLSIHHTRLKSSTESGGRTVLGPDPYEKDQYACGWTELKKGDEKTLYESGVSQGRSGVVRMNKKLQVTVRVVSSDCEPELERKQTVCNLKVTDGNDLDWSTKVTTKARISFE